MLFRGRTYMAETARSNCYERVDRLSSLPDSVICYILSFMPTKDATRNSILSTNWKHHFLNVLNINLEEEEEEDSLLFSGKKSGDIRDFVNRRLMLTATCPINRFRLKLSDIHNAQVSNLWLPHALVRNVKLLEIEVLPKGVGSENTPPLCLPAGIFSSVTIEVLKLSGNSIVVRIPEFVRLPNLKVLNLKNLDMEFDSSDNELSGKGFPLLETLRLDGIRLPEPVYSKFPLRISLPKLKGFEFIIPVDKSERIYYIPTRAPQLSFLKCSLTEEYYPSASVSCEYLASAKVSLKYVSPVCLLGCPTYFVRFLAASCYLKELHISKRLLELNEVSNSFPFPSFSIPDLTRLNLTAIRGSLWRFLKYSPELHALNFNLADGGTLHLLENKPPLCVVRSLREIRIENFKGNEDEFAIVNYFLKHGKVLESMIIQSSTQHVKEWKSETLLMLQRCSPNCEIDFT